MTLNQVETAISQFSNDELVRFREWFAQFDAEQWDQQIEQDVRDGKLDALANQALDHVRSNRCTPL